MAEIPPPLRRIDFRSAGNKLFKTRWGRVLYLVGGVCFIALLVNGTFTVYVHPNEMGIKQIIVGVHKGIGSTVYHPGLHWITPGTERMHTFPADIQLLNLTSARSERKLNDARSAPALNIQTSEGYTVSVDVSVLFRIVDPYKVMTTVGPGKLYEDSLVIPRSEQILRKRLGELDAEDFYNVEKRRGRVQLALGELNAELEPAGVHAMEIFVLTYTYDERYQSAIEQRKIQDQSVFKNKAEADMAAANAEKDRIVAVGEANVKSELARGDAEKRKTQAEAELYERKQKAAGGLEVKLAEAQGTKLENEALRGVGSENMVGLKMAAVLEGAQVIIVPTDGPNGTNPLDLQSDIKRFDVKQ